jgi:hypothetical protein
MLEEYFKNKASFLKDKPDYTRATSRNDRVFLMHNKYVAKVGDIGKYNIEEHYQDISSRDITSTRLNGTRTPTSLF